MVSERARGCSKISRSISCSKTAVIIAIVYQIESLSVRTDLLRILSMTLLFGCLLSGPVQAQTTPPPLMPLPAHMQMGHGEFLITNGFNIAFEGYREPRLDRAGARFLDIL